MTDRGCPSIPSPSPPFVVFHGLSFLFQTPPIHLLLPTIPQEEGPPFFPPPVVERFARTLPPQRLRRRRPVCVGLLVPFRCGFPSFPPALSSLPRAHALPSFIIMVSLSLSPSGGSLCFFHCSSHSRSFKGSGVQKGKRSPVFYCPSLSLSSSLSFPLSPSHLIPLLCRKAIPLLFICSCVCVCVDVCIGVCVEARRRTRSQILLSQIGRNGSTPPPPLPLSLSRRLSLRSV